MNTLASASTDSSLVRRVQAHDADAWRSFVQLYGPLIYAWCRRRGVPREDAADVTQDTFTAVAQAIANFIYDSPHGSFRGWLWTITLNKLRDLARRRGPVAAGGSDLYQRLQELPAEFPSEPADTAAQQDQRRLLHRAMEQVRAEFEPRTWQAFSLTILEGWDASRAAAELDTTANNVRQARSRVLRRLRQQLGEG